MRWLREQRGEHEGGVLSDGAIHKRVAAGELIDPERFSAEALHAASYDMLISQSGLIKPDGKKITPSPGHQLKRWVPSVTLESGDTALFSTHELFCMPPDVAGNITIKNRLAMEGLSLLSGLLVDPGYGYDELEPGERGCRLYLHVANTGRHPIVLTPGKDRIARIQFLLVVGERWSERKKARPSRWEEQQQTSLGFLTELKQLREDVRSSDHRSSQVVLFGIVVVIIALIGASFSSLLSIATNNQLSAELHKAWPNSSKDALIWLLVALVVGVWASFLVLSADKLWCHYSAQRRRKRRLEG